MSGPIELKPELKLTPIQWDFLGRVVKSNGGGVDCTSADQRTFRSLERRELIQGMSGKPWRAVHTPEGLKAWRQLCAKAEGGL